MDFAYIQIFVNFEQNDWARLLSMHKFVYNCQNTTIGHMFFELNCGYHYYVTYYCFYVSHNKNFNQIHVFYLSL